jgi:Na+-driven multidrug efflux pump
MIPRHEPPPSSSSTTKVTTRTKQNDQSSISSSRQERGSYKVNRIKVIGEIVKANVAMFLKQGSLLLGWAYATKRATMLGHTKVAAHQVALSLWLVFALVLDGASVAAQVLMARTYNSYKAMQSHDDSGDGHGKTEIRSLTKYMIKFALVQGLASTALIGLMGIMNAHTLFTSCEFTTIELVHLMPHLAWQQVLVSLTLVMEGLAVGANQFNWLAMGTSLATCWSIFTLSRAHTMIQIWSGGIVALFCGRLLTATLGVLHLNFGTFSFLTKRNHNHKTWQK